MGGSCYRMNLEKVWKIPQSYGFPVDDDDIVINRKSPDKSQEFISRDERIKRFFATADKLSKFNEVSPISEAEIQAEVEAYRSEKRTKKKDGV